MNKITEPGAISEYLYYLATFSMELRDQERVSQEDIDRLNCEADRLVEKLQAANIGAGLCESMKASRISTIESTPKKSRTMLFHLVCLVLFGWIGLIFSWNKELKNSAKRKDCLTNFRQDMLAFAADEKFG